MGSKDDNYALFNGPLSKDDSLWIKDHYRYIRHSVKTTNSECNRVKPNEAKEENYWSRSFMFGAGEYKEKETCKRRKLPFMK